MSAGSLEAAFLDVDATLVYQEFARAALAEAVGSTDGRAVPRRRSG